MFIKIHHDGRMTTVKVLLSYRSSTYYLLAISVAKALGKNGRWCFEKILFARRQFSTKFWRKKFRRVFSHSSYRRDIMTSFTSTVKAENPANPYHSIITSTTVVTRFYRQYYKDTAFQTNYNLILASTVHSFFLGPSCTLF